MKGCAAILMHTTSIYSSTRQGNTEDALPKEKNTKRALNRRPYGANITYQREFKNERLKTPT
jgi:hypothetical protein